MHVVVLSGNAFLVGSPHLLLLQIGLSTSTTGAQAARYTIWLLVALTPKGVVFSFLFDALPYLQS